MTSASPAGLDLGRVAVEVVTEDAQFQASYRRLRRQAKDLGTEFEQAARGVGSLDTALVTLARSATTVATFTNRASRASTDDARANRDDARATEGNAQAKARLARLMGQVADLTQREQQATLRAASATERQAEVNDSATASFRQLANAEAAVISSQRALGASSEAAGKAGTGAFGGMIRTAAELGLIVGGIEIAKKGIEFVGAGKELTNALNAVQAVSRATNAQMKDVRAEAIGLGKDLRVPGATAVDAAHAIEELVKAGIKLPRALQAARPALLLAAATNTGMADTARVLGDTMDIWSIKGQGAAHTAAILGAAALGASHDLVGLFDALKQAGPSARALHIGLDDTATALVFLAKHGLSTEMGGTGLKVLFSTLVKGTPAGVKALQDLGVTAFDTQGKFEGFPKVFDQLHSAQGRFGTDSHRFLHDLNAAFGTRAQNVASLFATATGKEFADLRKNLEAGDLQKFADTMNRGVSASFRQLSKQATAVGIDVYAGVEPKLTAVLQLISDGIPQAVDVARAGLTPFGAAWHAVDAVLGPVAGHLDDVANALGPVLPVVKGAAGATLAMWLAFKGYQVARLAANTIADSYATMRASAAGALVDVQRYGVGSGAAMRASAAEGEAASRIMQAEFDLIAASALTSAATVARSAAIDATAFADMTAASKASTDAQVADADARAAAALAAARSAATSAGIATGAAEESAAAINASGDAARLGWAGLAGPLGLAAVGVLSLVSLFHHSTSASKEATDAAKAYSEALKDAGSGQAAAAALNSEVVKRLAANGVADDLKVMNVGLRTAAVSGTELVHAISAGGKPLSDLRDRLREIALSGGTVKGGAAAQLNSLNAALTGSNPRAAAAAKLLKTLNEETLGLSNSQVTEIKNFKAFDQVVTPIQTVAKATGLATQTIQNYAGMVGIAATKNNDFGGSSKSVIAAVQNVAGAYDTATSAGSDFLASLDTFSKSAGTAADRATLIGSILKANAGDALSYESALNSASSAVATLGSNVKQAAMTAAGASKDSYAINKQYLAGLVATKTETIDYLGAQTKLTAGTINYSKTAAGPLLSDLSSIQSSALAAAQAQFQHSRALLGGKGAADAAVISYTGVENSLVKQLESLGVAAPAAQKLTDKYLGVPSKVRTLIEQAGADPVVDVLNKIGQQLSYLTGHAWSASITLDGTISANAKRILALSGTDNLRVTSKSTDPKYRAAGGGAPEGLFWTGEGGAGARPELVEKHGSNVHVYSHPQSVALAGAMGFKVPGFASGTSNYAAVAAALAKLGATRAGIAGFLGSTKIESDGSTTAHNAGENAWGLQQWEGGRLTALKKLAASMGASFTSQAAQVAMITHELTHGYSDTLKVLRTATSARKAAAYVDAHYERSSGDARTAREDAAAAFYTELGKSGKLAASSTAAKKAATVAAVSTSAIVAGLFGKGGTFSTELITSVKNSTKAITEKSGTAKAAQAAVVAHSTAVVNGAVAANVAPDPTQAQLIAALQSQLAGAVSKEGSAEIAARNLATLTANVTKLKASVASATKAARNASTYKQTLQAELTAAQTIAAKAKDAYGALADSAKTAMQAAAAAAKNLVASVQSDAATLTSTISDFRSSMRSSIVGDNSISSLWSTLMGATDADGNPIPATLTALQTKLNTVLTNTQAFTADLTSLVGEGANQDLITQITSLGTTAGDALAQQLIAAGPDAVTALQTTMASIQSVAGTEANQLATSFYGPGATAMLQFIAGLQSQFPSLTAALQTVANTVANAAGVTAPTITAPKTATAPKAGTASKPAPGTVTHPIITAAQAAKNFGVKLPSFSSGVTDFVGGLARVHRDELLVNLSPHSSVIPAERTPWMNRTKHPVMGATRLGSRPNWT